MLIIWGNTDERDLAEVCGRQLLQDLGNHEFYYDPEFPPHAKRKDLVLVMGSEFLGHAMKEGVYPKNRSIRSLRGTVAYFDTVPVMCTFSTFLARDDLVARDHVIGDLRVSKRFMRNGTLEIDSSGYRYVKSFGALIRNVKARFKARNEPVKMSCDLETVTLDPYNPKTWIVTIAFTPSVGRAYVMYFNGQGGQPAVVVNGTVRIQNREVYEQIMWLLTTDMIKICGANFKYDQSWFVLKWGFQCTNFSFDTTLAGSLIDENRDNSLNSHAKVMTEIGGYDDTFNANYDKGAMHRVPLTPLLLYSGGDSDANRRVALVESRQIYSDKRLARFYSRVLHPASDAFLHMEMRGVHLDREYYRDLRKTLRGRIREITNEVWELMPLWIKTKHRSNFKLTRAAIIRDYFFGPEKQGSLGLEPVMFTDKTKEPSAAENHLKKFISDNRAEPIIRLLKDYNSAAKTLSTYVEGFLSHIRADGLLHPIAILHRGDYGGTGQSGTVCLASTVPVLTNKGYLYAKNVEVGMRTLSHAGEWRLVTAKIDNGRKEVFRTTLSSGHVILTTGNHPFLTEDGWVRADALVEGQEVHVYGPAEIWRVVSLQPDYEISNWGRARHRETKRQLRPTRKDKWGHLKFDLGKGSARVCRGVHRLVASAFVANPEGWPEVRHVDGKAWNNVAWNLVWGTSKDNSQDAIRHGTLQGCQGNQAKLDWDLVSYIRGTKYVRGSRTKKGSDRRLAEELGVSRELVRDVRTRKKWQKRVPGVVEYSFSSADVISVESIGMLQTWGLEVETDHSHVTAGIVTHNTGRTAFKDPAMQCMPAETEVLTSQGYVPLGYIVQRHEVGEQFEVKTHDGSWKPVTDVYRNGHKPVLRITTATGKQITCTMNHPVLTPSGWVLACHLSVDDNILTHRLTGEDSAKIRELSGQEVWSIDGLEETRKHESSHWDLSLCLWDNLTCAGRKLKKREYNFLWLQVGQGKDDARAQERRKSICCLSQLVFNEESMSKSERENLQVLWGESNQGVRSVAGLLAVSGGHGRTSHRVHFREARREWELRASKLHLDSSVRAEQEQAEFQEEQVICIEPLGVRETFDLTIEDNHSFVANGVVVHNTLPKHTIWAKPLRKGYYAPPGFVIISWDYSQGELRITACLANEPNMLRAYKKGIDLHLVTGSRLSGIPLDRALEMMRSDDPKIQHDIGEVRFNGKAGNFGLIYGMSPDGYVEYVWDTFGKVMQLTTAEDHHAGFFQLYNRLPAWHNKFKRIAEVHKQIRSPLGRIRHLPMVDSRDRSLASKARRQAVNSPVQSTLSDLVQLALVEFHDEYGYPDGCQFFRMTHDEVSAYVAEDEVEIWGPRMKEIMEGLPLKQYFGWEPQLTFEVDWEYGPNLAEMKKAA